MCRTIWTGKENVFKIVDRSTMSKRTRVYGTRWVNTLKLQEDGTHKEKSRLFAQNFRDYQARSILAKAPTISKLGQRLAIAIAAMHPDGHEYVRDITQAYVQSRSKLERDVNLEPPTEIHLPEEKVLIAVKPLYGVPESGFHWFLTYKGHHVDKVHMKQCAIDKCLLYIANTNKNCSCVPHIAILQVDDSFRVGCKKFLEEEEDESQASKVKPWKNFEIGGSHTFKRSIITREGVGTYSINNQSKLEELEHPNSDAEMVSCKNAVYGYSIEAGPRYFYATADCGS